MDPSPKGDIAATCGAAVSTPSVIKRGTPRKSMARPLATAAPEVNARDSLWFASFEDAFTMTRASHRNVASRCAPAASYRNVR
jgi:hypothetical protein